MRHFFIATSTILVLPLLLGSCATSDYFKLAQLSILPSEIPSDASPDNVRNLLGEPTWTEVVGREGSTRTHVWHYVDKWHSNHEFGSWAVYFREFASEKESSEDPVIRYVGWRATEPTSSETGAREVFHAPR